MMDHVTAVVSLLHEPATTNSATRTFRRQPVLSWTLQRLHGRRPQTDCQKFAASWLRISQEPSAQ